MPEGPPDDAGPPDRVLDRLPEAAQSVVVGMRFRRMERTDDGREAVTYRVVAVERERGTIIHALQDQDNG